MNHRKQRELRDLKRNFHEDYFEEPKKDEFKPLEVKEYRYEDVEVKNETRHHQRN